jgi:hypothetical protein
MFRHCVAIVKRNEATRCTAAPIGAAGMTQARAGLVADPVIRAWRAWLDMSVRDGD